MAPADQEVLLELAARVIRNVHKSALVTGHVGTIWEAVKATSSQRVEPREIDLEEDDAPFNG